MEQCQFCHNMFGDKKMLRQHQKKTKYCLKIQVEAKEKDEIITVQETNKELNCKFCGNKFKTKYLLNKHQTQSKYCILLQESQKSEVIVKSFVTCTFCNKNFSSSTFNIEKGNLAAGNYLYKVINTKDTHTLKSGKLIIE